MTDRVPSEEALAAAGRAMAERAAAVLPGWLAARAEAVAAQAGRAADPELADALRRATAEAARATVAALVALAATDVDGQRTTPLGALRSAVSGPSAVLQRAGVPPATPAPGVRAEAQDPYRLAPGRWDEVDPELGGLALAWGAAKAAAHHHRHGR